MDGIKLEQMGRRRRIAGRVVDVHQLDSGTPPQSPEHQTPDPTEAIDADPHATHHHLSTYFDPSRSARPRHVMPDTLSTDQSRQRLKALADPIRLEVIHSLAQGERCVCDLTSALDLSQSRLSFHLRVLREAGLLTDRQSGRWTYYRLQPQAIAELEQWLAGLRSRCSNPAPPCTP